MRHNVAYFIKMNDLLIRSAPLNAEYANKGRSNFNI